MIHYVCALLFLKTRAAQREKKQKQKQNKTEQKQNKNKQNKTKQTSIERLRLFANTRPHNRGKEMVYCTGFSSIYRIKILADLNNIL